MSTDNNIWALAEVYVAGNMPATDQAALKERLATDLAFANEFNECVNMLRSLEGFGAYSRFQNMLQDVRSKQNAEKKSTPARTIPLRTHYFRTASVAAGIALLTTLGTFWLVNHSRNKERDPYDKLANKVNQQQAQINRQGQLINDIKVHKDQDALPPAVEANATGTGFAITNDGYFITDYHVIAGADSIYIQNKDGGYFRTYVVDYDNNTDIALLKVEKSSFRFGKTDVPYTFATSKAAIGSRVYTLGFPGDDILYSEGYISSRNGYQGDTMQYRLEIPAYHGQSGGPVVDANGNLVAVIAANGAQSKDATYAVSSKAVLNLVKNLDKNVNIRLPKANKFGKLSHEEQIEKLQSYTCRVKVYK